MPNHLLSHRVHGRTGNPALLLLHGFLGCTEDWHEVATVLSRDRFVVAVDLPGHGGSIEGLSAPDYTMTGCAELLVSLLDSLNVNECSVAGYSMGGRTALCFAVRNADRCNRIILESASPGLRTETERAARRAHDEAVAERLLTGNLDQFLSDWYAQPLFEPLRQSARFGELVERRRRNNPQGLALSLKHMGTGAQPALWDSLPAIPLPILLLTGELDTKFTRIAQEIAAVCPHARTQLIAGAGHTLHFEAPDRYIAAVQRFLMERK
jgi:2-succinyl-6-hydroxy-2,4-cyclohexadiene-1-carboxylate synthase